MSFVDTRSVLEQRLRNGWTRTPIRWQAVPFTIPADVHGNLQPYVAFTLRNGAAEDLVLGSNNPEWRFYGVVIVSIFVPEQTGLGLATFYGDLIKTIYLQTPRAFTYLNSGVIRLFVPQVTEVGTVAGWEQVNVITGFRRDARS